MYLQWNIFIIHYSLFSLYIFYFQEGENAIAHLACGTAPGCWPVRAVRAVSARPPPASCSVDPGRSRVGSYRLHGVPADRPATPMPRPPRKCPSCCHRTRGCQHHACLSWTKWTAAPTWRWWERKHICGMWKTQQMLTRHCFCTESLQGLNYTSVYRIQFTTPNTLSQIGFMRGGPLGRLQWHTMVIVIMKG